VKNQARAALGGKAKRGYNYGAKQASGQKELSPFSRYRRGNFSVPGTTPRDGLSSGAALLTFAGLRPIARPFHPAPIFCPCTVARF
jgi:hypothetical protein